MGAVASVVEDERGTGDAVGGGDEQVPRKIAAFVGDRDRDRWWVEQADVEVEAFAMSGEQFAELGVGVLRAVNEDVGGGVIDGCP